MPTRPPDPSPAAHDLQGTVLYIEDDRTNFLIVDAILSAHPRVQLIEAQTGLEGVDLANSENPDVILLDMNLPDISGIEVIRRLSERLSAGDFRVIILTSNRLNIDVLKAMSLGASEYLIKPPNIQALEAAIGRALSSKPRGW